MKCPRIYFSSVDGRWYYSMCTVNVLFVPSLRPDSEVLDKSCPGLEQYLIGKPNIVIFFYWCKTASWPPQ